PRLTSLLFPYTTLFRSEAVVCWVLMLSGANSRVVAQNAAAKLAEIQKKLPAGIRARPLYERSDLVNHTIETAERNLFEGAVLVVDRKSTRLNSSHVSIS